ncbi:MAG: acetate--CoA ligase family protein [Anaerotignum faecicola]|uniref:acetate--CoA ligase family protein n=1 Tax=Clostridium sp. MCC345 TaxID=2592645 RepID=UPI001C018439|nr:CoA-binding protein [Clostridium sp. MCC345]
MDISKLLRPRAVAVVGASEKSGFGGDTCRNILENQADTSHVYPVNPKKETVFGKKCYPTLADLPEEIDLVILCTSQKTIVDFLKQAKAKGAGAAVVYASGYSEVGTAEGKAFEKELVDAAKALDMVVMGPNCAGYINFGDDIFSFAFIGDYKGKKGNIGFVSQSGQFCIDMMKSAEMKYSFAISAGNSAMVQMEDYLNFLIDDSNTKVIALYLEGVKNPHKFEACLQKAMEKKKPVVILKAGRSPKGQATAASHTGSMAGSDKTYDAVFEKFGVIRADDMQDLRSTASLLATLRVLPKKPAFSAMCLSGGETAVSADTGFLHGIEYPDFSEVTLKKLNDMLPDFATPRNPLDMTAALCYDADAFASGITTVMSDPSIEMGLVGLTISDKVTVSNDIMFEGIRRAFEQIPDKPLAVMSFMEAARNKELVERFQNAGIPVLPTTKYGFRALQHLQDFISHDTIKREARLAIPEAHSANTRALSEYESKKLLADNGVPVDLGYIAKTKAEIKEYAEKIGYPLVMKVESNDILHKSDVGGVMLNIKSLEQAEEAYDKILANAAQHAPNAKINGILMQKMLKAGTEMIIGLNSDPQFGPMLLVGMGGVFVEVFKDAALYPVPLNHDEALHMLQSLKSFKLLNGYRGNPPADIEALTDMMVKISDFAYRKKDTLKELDMNPLFVYPKGEGVAIADALAVMYEEEK